VAGAEERLRLEECREILGDLGLSGVAREMAGNLPFGTMKRVEIARALASRPQLLLLDEPAAGLTHGEVVGFGRLIGSIRERFAVTVLLVEHNMNLVMDLCSRLLVLNFGRLLGEGTPDQIRRDPAIVAAYLGEAP
jgi:branched-chain amino acid transport system ATP-binding protein